MTSITGDIIINCWCLFIFVWIISAARTKRIVEKQSMLSALAHRIPVGIGWWLMAFPNYGPPLTDRILPHTAGLEIVGSALCILGLLFTLWARRTLAGNWSSDVNFKQNHELIRTGPYRLVRHPIYTGLLVMFLGTALFLGQVRGAVGVILVALGFWIKLRQEERLLVRHFPDSYPTYQHEVKALIPFLI